VQDRSQPDVFETSDLPEDEQHLDSQVTVCIFKVINIIFSTSFRQPGSGLYF